MRYGRVLRQAAAELRPRPRVPSITGLTRASDEAVLIECSNGSSIELPNVYLRDSSTHPAHVHPSSRQKLFRTSDVPASNELKGWNVHGIENEGECLVCEWDEPVNGERLSLLPVELLLNLVESKDTMDMPSSASWDAASLRRRLVQVNFDEYMHDDTALRSVLTALLRDGIAFVKNVPTKKKEGHHTSLRTLVERIGSVRRTWYGDLWDVKAEEGSLNIAYTDLDLGLHMDLVHMHHPPRFQFLHSLMNHEIEGGESYFVDSYELASLLSPKAYETLCRVPVTFEYKAGSHHTRFVRPTIEVGSSDKGSIEAVNYSPPFQGPLTRAAFGRSRDLLDALKEFASLADRKELQYRRQLEPGDCVLFDNRRTLHARTAFAFSKATSKSTSMSNGGSTGERGRWLKGAYMDEDEVKSKWRVLSAAPRTRHA